MHELEGEIVKVVRFDNGYTVLTIRPPKGSELVLTGNMPVFHEGMNIKAKGMPFEHPKYGKQFKVEEIQEHGFGSTESLIDYLSAAFFGVGRVLARRIVDNLVQLPLMCLTRSPNWYLK